MASVTSLAKLEPSGGRAARRASTLRPRLDRDRLLAAALRLVDAEGLDAVTMRRLGAELGVRPMALYRYVPDRDALLDGMVEEVLAEMKVDPTGYDDWTAGLRAAAEEFRRVAHRHPNIVPLLVNRPLAVPLARRTTEALIQVEQLLSVFERAGFDPTGAWIAYQTYTAYLAGSLLVQFREVVEEDPSEPDVLVKLGLHRLPAPQFPRLRRDVPVLARLDQDHAFERGLDLVLDGLDRLRTSPA